MNIQVDTCASLDLCTVFGPLQNGLDVDRRSPQGAGGAEPPADPAVGSRGAPVRHRDRRAVRDHPAGRVPAPEGAPRGGASGRPAWRDSSRRWSRRMTAEPYQTAIDVAAPPEVVYAFFTEPDAIVRWMGDYAVLDARPGGEFTVDITGVPVRGRYVEVDPPHRLLI